MRKRADLAFKVYLIRHNEELAAARAVLDGPRLAASRKLALEKDYKTLVRSKVSHFCFLEDIVGYQIIMVCVPVLLHTQCSTHHEAFWQAYNSLIGPGVEVLLSPDQWRTALTLHLWPRTNKPLPGTGKGKAKSKGLGDSCGNASGGSSAAGKRVRASKYPLLPTGNPHWPERRSYLCGKHPVGWHELGTGMHTCDFPQCHLSDLTTASTSTLKTPKRASSSHAQTTPGSSRATSETGSETGSESGMSSVRVKMFCKVCLDPTGSRSMNFHADCWNRWHGIEELNQVV